MSQREDVVKALGGAIEALEGMSSIVRDDAALFQEMKDSWSEAEVRKCQEETNSLANEARAVGNDTLARIYQNYLLIITRIGDAKRQERYDSSAYQFGGSRMNDYDSMTEDELRDLQVKMNQEIKSLRDDVLKVQAAGDKKQQERYAKERASARDRDSVEVQGAISEAESIVRPIGE